MIFYFASPPSEPSIVKGLYCVRATDVDATGWHDPLIITDTGGAIADKPAVCLINWKPAVVFYSATFDTLGYMRSLDSQGTD